MLRRWFYLAVAGGLVAATTVAFASASRSAPSKPHVAPESANAWLPTGLTPAGHDWETTGGDLAGSSFSTLKQINTSNVSRLKMVWQKSYNGPGQGYQKPENQPIVLSGPDRNLPLATGTMFLPTNQGVVALNPESGDIIWQYKGALEKGGAATPGSQEGIGRSIAYGRGAIFAGQQDGSLVALNSKTGALIWTTQVAGAGTFGRGNVYGESNPWAIFIEDNRGGLILSAPNGGDSPMRGHFDAYDARTGKLAWRTFTTPDPSEFPHILSWANPAEAAVGGAAVWSLPAVDPDLGLVYFGTGNPYPYTGRQPGKNLFTDSLMAVSLRTGALKWYYQLVHHDLWDYDVSNPPMRVNPVIDGKRVPVVAIGGKNGWMYVLNAKNGGPVPHFPIPEVKVPDLNGGKGAALGNTWPTQPEPQGGAGQILPHCITAAEATAIIPGFPTAPDGKEMIPTCTYAAPYNDAYLLVYPAFSGGINWPRNSYNPATNDLYICAQISVMGFMTRSPTDPRHLMVGSYVGGDGGTISALNMSTNKLDWQINIPRAYDTPGGPTVRNGDCWSGTMATAGGLVFVAQNVTAFSEGIPPVPGVFYAYDAKTGKQLWSFTNNQGSTVRAAPVTYMVKGKQYVAIMMTSLLNPNGSSGITVNPTAPPTDRLTIFSL